MDEKLESLINAAKIHGHQSDSPDHEVGDLIDILRTCWNLLSDDDKEEVLEDHHELIENWSE